MKHGCSGINELCHCRQRYPRGYTLIEVVIATAIFSAMMLLATMALNQGLSQYRGLMDKGVTFWETARHLWLNRSIGSVTDYYVSDDAGKWFPYFRGSEDMISYVSLAPFAGDLPVVVWITRERGENGKYALIYREFPVYTSTWRDLDGNYTMSKFKTIRPLVIMEDLDSLSFRYYGHVFSKYKEEWSNDFDGRKRLMLPGLVGVDYSLEGKKGTRFFSIHTNASLKAGYDEIYQP